MIYRELGYELYYSDEPFKGKLDISHLNDRGGKFADYIWQAKRYPSTTRYLDNQLLHQEHPKIYLGFKVSNYIQDQLSN